MAEPRHVLGRPRPKEEQMFPHNRIPTTHVGSLVRPPELLRTITAIEQGIAVDRAAFDGQLRRAVAEVVERQKAAGIDIVSDGEFGKLRTWSAYVLERLGNIEEQNIDEPRGIGRDQSLFAEFYAEYFPTQRLPRRGVPIATGPIFYRGQAAIAHDIDVFKSALEGHADLAGFVPLVAPASAMPRFRLGHYRTEEEFLFGLAEALRVEYRAVLDAGLLLQIDDAFLPYMYDVAFADRPLDEYRKWAELRVAALNHALDGLPEDRVRYHICWGSFAVPHVGDIELKHIIDLVLKVKAGAYCIEMANPRHEHEWRIWENVKLPEGRKLVPGVVSHATNIVEHPELVAERLVRLARLVGRDNLLAGTDCGFAQATQVRRVHPSIQWAKLEALAAGARLASRELWGG
jgi:5-methyltetrahydropteroyltriglutamate--homocysteine methyltransferase